MVIIFVKVKPTLLYTFFLFVFVCSSIQAQRSDSLNKVITADSIHTKKEVSKAIYGSAHKATILSTCLPGLGQAYNKKYWKIPIIYAAFGGLAYWGINNHNEYKYYSNNLKAIYDDDPNTNNTSRYTEDQLITEKKQYKKYRDMAIIFGALLYSINIIDANVDAHLKTFDISDDLSLQVKPYTGLSYNYALQTGITLKLKFK